jgi:hypothetical protein
MFTGKRAIPPGLNNPMLSARNPEVSAFQCFSTKVKSLIAFFGTVVFAKRLELFGGGN